MRMVRILVWVLTVGWGTLVSAGSRTVSTTPEGPALRLNDYLSDVKSKNLFFQGAMLRKEGARKRQRGAELLTSPALFTNAGFRTDGKLPQLPLFTYEKIEGQAYSLGVTQATSFGLQGKLAYEVDYISYVNSSLQATAAAQGFPLTYYDVRPVLELTQPLLQNGFGASLRSMQDGLREQARAEEYAAQAESESLLIQAETAYWRLAAAREIVDIQEAALKHAQSIYDYVFDKDRRNLGDKADTLQAKALLESRRLELKTAQDEERLALRAFNGVRNAPSAEAVGQLEPFDGDALAGKSLPEKFSNRSDVKAAEAQSKAAAANARVQAEKDRPTLDLVGSVAFNGRNADLGEAFQSSYRDHRPTYALGVRFVLPLDVNELSDAHEGALQIEKAAELQFRQRLEDQRVSWEELSTRISNAKERLQLAKTLEETQKTKLDYERTRLRQGRTTTYQILMFEQDFLQAELARLRFAVELVNLFAQSKLYQGEAP